MKGGAGNDGDAPATILHVITSLGIGGAERALQRLLASFPDGYCHKVVSLRDVGPIGAELRASGINVRALGATGLLSLLYAFSRLARIIRQEAPDIVQCWLYHADFIGGLAARMAGCRAVLWGIRSANLGERLGVSTHTIWLRRLCAMMSATVPTRILYVAQSARTLHEELGYAPSKSVVIPNGYSIPVQLACDESRRSFRETFGLPDGALLVGSVGRFTGLKDHQSFIAACGRVAAAMPDAYFVLIGTGLDYSNVQLADWIGKTGRPDRFLLLGERDDLSAMLRGLDLFCLHSVGEGFPNVVAEAMAAGLPCLVTDVGDAALIVADTGQVVPPSDIASLAHGMQQMLTMPATERAALGAKARMRIATEFSIEAVRARHEAVYAELLGRSSLLAGGGPASLAACNQSSDRADA